MGKRLVNDRAADNVVLSVSNFGPIAKAKVRLRPLTVFVGPSNTGKSWLSALVYSMHKFVAPFRRITYWPEAVEDRKGTISPRLLDAVKSGKSSPILEKAARKHLDMCCRMDSERLAKEMCRCYGIKDLEDFINRTAAPGTGARIQFHNGPAAAGPPLDLDMTLAKGGLSIKPASVAALRRQLSDYFENHFDKKSFLRLEEHDSQAVLPILFSRLHTRAYECLRRSVLYMPADRTGIMHAHNVVISALLERASMEGLRPSPPLPLLSGVLADFLMELIHLDLANSGRRFRFSGNRRLHRELSKTYNGLADRIERDIIGGKIEIERSKMTRKHEFSYRPHNWKKGVPLMNASSMVSELAPLVLFLRHSIDAEGGLLIMEEPESHLHPGKQADLVNILAAMVNSGVRIIMTTHSDWVLESLANVVLGSRQGVAGNGAEAVLDENDVGVWLFRDPAGSGNKSVVEEIPLGEAGIYDSGYDAVADQLYNKWVSLADNGKKGRCRKQ